MLVKLGRVAKSIPHCEQAVLIDPTCDEAHYNLGRALQVQPDSKEARSAFERASLKKEQSGDSSNKGFYEQNDR